jgi:hypothetical protein
MIWQAHLGRILTGNGLFIPSLDLFGYDRVKFPEK